MSELSCGTRFIGRNETLDLSLYHNNDRQQQQRNADNERRIVCTKLNYE